MAFLEIIGWINRICLVYKYCITVYVLRNDFSFVRVDVIYIYIYNGRVDKSNIQDRGGCPCGVMIKAMVCEIVAREFEIQSCYYVHFRQIPLGKVWTPLSSQLWVK